MLSVRGLSKRLGAFQLREVSFDVNTGDYFVLLGASGVGKSVLIETLAGYAKPDAGSVWLDGEDITRRPVHLRGLAAVFQEPALFPHRSVARNIAYGLHDRGLSRAVIRDRVHDLAAEVGAQHLLERQPGTLSGGEAQRVALARCLAVEPRCLLLDEPLVALDTEARLAMRALLRLVHRRGLTVVHVTHDYEETVSLATHAGILEDGRLVQVGPSPAIFQRPRTPFAARFTGYRNCIPGRLDRSADGHAFFDTGAWRFPVYSAGAAGPGFLAVRSCDVLVCVDGWADEVHAVPGTVRDLVPVPAGLEVVVDVDVEVACCLPPERALEWGATCGASVFVGIDPSRAVFIEAS